MGTKQANFQGVTENSRSAPVCAGPRRSAPVCAGLCRSAPVRAGLRRSIFKLFVYWKFRFRITKLSSGELRTVFSKGRAPHPAEIYWKKCTRKVRKGERGTRELFRIFRVLRQEITFKFINIFRC